MADSLPDDQQAKMLALVQALRGQPIASAMDPQRAAALADQDKVGLLLQSSGDRVLAPMGQGLLSRGQQERQAEALAPVRRLQAQAAATRAQTAEEKASRPDMVVKEAADGSLFSIDKHDPSAAPKLLHTSTKRLGKGGGSGGGVPGAPPGGVAPEMLDFYAQEYNAGKDLPASAKGKAGRLLAAAIEARAHQLDPKASHGSAASDFKADASSLQHAQQQRDAVMGFIGTFDRNVNLLEDALSKLNSSNSPFLNKGLRYLQANAQGDPNYTTFINALNTVTAELGKINSGSTGAGGTPISVLEEMKHGLPADATPAQILAAVKLYRKDSENRRDALDENVRAIQSRRDSRGKKGEAPPAEAPRPATAATGLPPDIQAKASARIKQLISQGVTDRKAIKDTLIKEGLAPPEVASR